MSNDFCPGCFKEYNQADFSECPHCGFNENTPIPDNALKPHTILLDKFMLGKVLNIDGEGIEYLAFDAVRKDRVVIKEYMPASVCVRNDSELLPKPGCETKFKFLQSDFEELFKSLIDCSALTHIRSVFEVFNANNTVYAVCEYFEYKTLNKHISDNAGELEYDEALELFKPLLEDLTIINSAKIVHRGITPQSIVIKSDGTIKLIGFTITSTKSFNSEIQTDLSDGYAAPEQYSTTIPHGEWTDVYAVCAVLYKSLGGVMPPSAQSRIVNDNLISLASLNSSIPVHISNAVMEGLTYDYKERTTNIRSLITNLYSNAFAFDRTSVFDKIETVDTDEDDEVEEAPAKKEMSLMLKALLIATPILLIFVVLLYISIFNVDIFGSSNDDDDISTSDETSDLSDGDLTSDDDTIDDSDDTSDESTSSETSSEPDVEEAIVIDFRNNFFTDVSTTEQYTALFTFAAEYEYNEDLIEGIIISQDIAPNTEVEVGTLITFKVSKGSKFIDIPSQSEISIMKAVDLESFFKEKGIDCRIVFEPHETAELGIVTRLEGATAGTQIDIESGVTVIIYASNGEAPPSSSQSEPDIDVSPSESEPSSPDTSSSESPEATG